jgi:hypothetical protein
METLKYNVVERLADLLLGEKLPIPMEPGVPKDTMVTKEMLGTFYDGFLANNWHIDPSPIRMKVIAAIERETEQWNKTQPFTPRVSIELARENGLY